jgi:hypothetical protein
MNKKNPPASIEDTGKFLLEHAVPIPESYEMGKYSFLEVMKRVRAGESDHEDAEQIERWVIGDPRGNTVRGIPMPHVQFKRYQEIHCQGFARRAGY